MLISLLAITVFYVLVSIVMMASVEGEWWLNSDGEPREDPIFAFFDAVASTRVGIVLAILAVLTMISGALSVTCSIEIFVRYGKGCLLPDSLSDTNKKFETRTGHYPNRFDYGSLHTYSPREDVAKLASGFQIMVIVALNVSVIVLRRENKGTEWYEPTFKSPLYPYVQIFGTIAGAYLVVIMGSKAIIGASAAVVIGVSTYYIYGKKNYQVESLVVNEEE